MPPDPTRPRHDPPTRRILKPLHLARRFFGSLLPLPPRRSDTDWIVDQLLPGELELWAMMRPADRRHAAGVARRVVATLGPDVGQDVVAAALLHDVGKVDSRLGTYGRVIATLSGAVVGHDPEIIAAWTRTAGFTRRVGLYLQHPKVGGDRLAMAGSAPLTEAWAREHHKPPAHWTVPIEVATALAEADDD
jgi:hypothetical protein